MAESPRKNTGSAHPGAKATRASRLTADLRKLIVRGDLKAGEKLNLAHLQKMFGVSLSPLREALSRLVTTGFVDMEDQRGYRVAPLTADNLAEIVSLRVILEQQALRESIRHADLEWESSVMRALHHLNRALSNPTDADARGNVIEAQAEFHASLIANCRMPMTIDLCRTMFDLNARYDYRFGAGPAAEPVRNGAYSPIADAAVSRDAETASALLGLHIKRAGAVLAERTAAGLRETASTEDTA